MLPLRFRRSLSIFIPLASAAAFFGLTNGFAKIGDNLASTGITLGIILGILNLINLYLAYKHQTP